MTHAVLPDTPSTILTTSQLAAFFGVDERTVANWRKKGVPSIKRGNALSYDLKRVMEWREDEAVRKATEGMTARLGEADREEAETRKVLAQAQLAELDVSERRGQLVNIEDADRELQKHLTACRALLTSFPARLAPLVLHLTDELPARELLQREVRSLMDAMAIEAEQLEVATDAE